MALEKKTIKIIVIAVLAIIAVALLLGLLLGFLLKSDTIQLEVYPRGADGSAQPLISYEARNNISYSPWVQRLNDSLKEYRYNGASSSNRKMCSFTSPPNEKEVCDVPVQTYYPCTAPENFNYPDGTPCIFLKLNKILKWNPKPYNNMSELPKKMPEDLKLHIKSVAGKPEANEVWVSCEGESPDDKANLGRVQYTPGRGFPTYYFPSGNKQGYLSPVVGVVFENPKNATLINVICKAWAKNIACENCEQTASVHFKLLVTR